MFCSKFWNRLVCSNLNRINARAFNRTKEVRFFSSSLLTHALKSTWREFISILCSENECLWRRKKRLFRQIVCRCIRTKLFETKEKWMRAEKKLHISSNTVWESHSIWSNDQRSMITYEIEYFSHTREYLESILIKNRFSTSFNSIRHYDYFTHNKREKYIES